MNQVLEFLKSMPVWYVYIPIYIGLTGWFIVALVWGDIGKKGKKPPSLKENVGWTLFFCFWPLWLPLFIIAVILDST